MGHFPVLSSYNFKQGNVVKKSMFVNGSQSNMYGIAEFENINENPTLSPDVQNLIQKAFSFSQTKEMAEVEGVLALAKFGQYEQALEKFYRLLGKGIASEVVAKHIIDCHLAISSPATALAQYDQWASNGLLTKEALADVKAYLDDILRTKGIKSPLPRIENTPKREREIREGAKKDRS